VILCNMVLGGLWQVVRYQGGSVLLLARWRVPGWPDGWSMARLCLKVSVDQSSILVIVLGVSANTIGGRTH